MASKTDPPPTTEVVLRNGKTAMISAEFAEKYPGLAPDEETLELLAENLGGDTEIGVRNFKRVKVPSSDSKSWMINSGGKEIAIRKLRGVLVAWSARRSFWVNGEPDGSRPDCSSVDVKVPLPGGMFAPDGERGAQNPSGKCGTCPMAQFGSDPKGGGQACKEQRLFYFMTEGAIFPLILHIPRTSIKPATDFMLDLFTERKRYYQVEVEIGLEQTSSKAGQAYNQATFEVIRHLEDDEVAAVKAYSDQIKDLVREFNASFDRDSVVDADGGYSVSEPATA